MCSIILCFLGWPSFPGDLIDWQVNSLPCFWRHLKNLYLKTCLYFLLPFKLQAHRFSISPRSVSNRWLWLNIPCPKLIILMPQTPPAPLSPLWQVPIYHSSAWCHLLTSFFFFFLSYLHYAINDKKIRRFSTVKSDGFLEYFEIIMIGKASRSIFFSCCKLPY